LVLEEGDLGGLRFRLEVRGAGMGLAIALVGASHAEAQDATWQWSGQVAVATEGVSKDVDETAGRGQLQGLVEVTRGPIFGSAFWRNLSEPGGINGQEEYVLGAKGQAEGFDIDFSGGYKIKDNAPAGFQAHFVEWQTDISRTLATGTTLRLTDIYSPNAPGATKEDNFVEAGLSQAVNSNWSVSGALAARQRSPANNYSAVNLGVTYVFPTKTSLDLRYYDANGRRDNAISKSRLVMQLTRGF